MKKIYIFLISALFISVGIFPVSADETKNDTNYDYYLQDFLVSAYYSPLPNQTKYIRGSYEKDLALNGNGTNAADGTEVHMGMLAAPRSYKFGTKIDLPGLGVGVVHDRGGAIIEGASYHRIDVWMGRGDEGLKRALNWGMRKVTGKVYFDSKVVSMNLDYTSVPSDLPETPVVNKTSSKKSYTKKSSNAVAKQETPSPTQVSFQINANISKSSSKEDIMKLQMALSAAGTYTGAIHGQFTEETETAIFSFQKQQGILANRTDSGAGIFGEKTRKVLVSTLNTKQKTTLNVSMEKSQILEGVVKKPIIAELTPISSTKTLSFSGSKSLEIPASAPAKTALTGNAIAKK